MVKDVKKERALYHNPLEYEGENTYLDGRIITMSFVEMTMVGPRGVGCRPYLRRKFPPLLYMAAGRPLVDDSGLLLSCSRLQEHQPIGNMGCGQKTPRF